MCYIEDLKYLYRYFLLKYAITNINSKYVIWCPFQAVLILGAFNLFSEQVKFLFWIVQRLGQLLYGVTTWKWTLEFSFLSA